MADEMVISFVDELQEKVSSVNELQKKVGTFLNEPFVNIVTLGVNPQDIAIDIDEASEECIMNFYESPEEILDTFDQSSLELVESEKLQFISPENTYLEKCS